MFSRVIDIFLERITGTSAKGLAGTNQRKSPPEWLSRAGVTQAQRIRWLLAVHGETKQNIRVPIEI